MDERHVVAAVEVVVDEHLPVAVDGIVPARVKRQLVHAVRRQLVGEITQRLFERSRRFIEIDPGPVLPGLHPHRRQAMIQFVESGRVVHARRPLQRTVEPVGPAVVRALQVLEARAERATFVPHHARGVMAADIVKAADAVFAAHQHQRLVAELPGDELAHLGQFVEAGHGNPVAVKDGAALFLVMIGVGVPVAGQRLEQTGATARVGGVVHVAIESDSVASGANPG